MSYLHGFKFWRHVSWDTVYILGLCNQTTEFRISRSSRLRWWPTAASMVRVQPTSTASVVQSHLSRAVRCWGQPTTENSLSPKREESTTVHAASVMPHHLSGTIYRDSSEMMTLVVNNSLAIWRHFCLHGPIRQRRLWERLFKRCFIKGLTYLLQYCSPLLPNTLVVQVEQSVWGVCVSVTRNLTFEPNNLYTNIFGKQVQLDSI